MCWRRTVRWRGASSIGAREQIPGLVEGALDYRGEFRVSSNSFFQVNRFLIDRLVEAAMEGAEGETALDLYAGVGLLSMPLARRFREVTAVESGAGAVRDLQFNAERAGLANLHAVAADRGGAPGAVGEGAGFRGAGSAAHGVGQGGGGAVGGIAAAADHDCGLRSGDAGARSGGTGGGGVSGEQMTLVDLFPQTYHLETVVRLSLE